MIRKSMATQEQEAAIAQTQANAALIEAGYTPTYGGWVSSSGSNVGQTTTQAMQNEQVKNTIAQPEPQSNFLFSLAGTPEYRPSPMTPVVYKTETQKFAAEGKGVFGGMSNVGGGKTAFVTAAPIMSVEPSTSPYGYSSHYKADKGAKEALIYSPKEAYRQIGEGKTTSLEINAFNAKRTSDEMAASKEIGVIGGVSMVGGSRPFMQEPVMFSKPERVEEGKIKQYGNKAFRDFVSGAVGYGVERGIGLYEIISPPVKYIPKSVNLPFLGEISPKTITEGVVSGAILISPFGQGEAVGIGTSGTATQKAELKTEIGVMYVLGGGFGTAFGTGAKIQPEFTASSTGFISPSAKLVAENPLGAAGIVKEAPARLTMTTRNVGSGIEIKVDAQQGLVKSSVTATVPNEFISLGSSDASYARTVRNLKPETQFVYPRSVTTPFNIEVSTVGGGKMKVPGSYIETQTATSMKLQPFEKSVSVGKGGVEPIGKARVVSAKEYYIGETRVGARTNVETFYTGLAKEVKTPLGKGYELSTYKKTTGGTYELLPGGGKMVTKQPTAEFAGNVVIEMKTSAKTFAQASPNIKAKLETLGVQTKVSGKYVGEGNVEIDVSGAKFLYPERLALGEKGTVGGFRIVGKLGNANMESFALTERPPTPKTEPKNVGDIPTISFGNEVINPKKSQEFLGVEAIPTPKSPSERTFSVQEMGGTSVTPPKVLSVQIQKEMPTQVFKDVEREGNLFSTYQASTEPKMKFAEGSAGANAFLPMPTSTKQAPEQIQIRIEKTFSPISNPTNTYQSGQVSIYNAIGELSPSKPSTTEKILQAVGEKTSVFTPNGGGVNPERAMVPPPRPYEPGGELNFVLPPPPDPPFKAGGFFIPAVGEEGGRSKKFKIKQNLRDLLSIDKELRKKGF